MDKRIEKVVAFIEANLSQKYQLSELAKRACLSPSQFHRLFKKETNSTPFQFIEKLKMNKAYQLIVDKTPGIQALSLLLGYNDYETFSRAFKKHYHFAPDDLKAISQKVKTQISEEEEKDLIISTADEIENEEKLLEKIRRLIRENNIAPCDIRKVKIFMITPKTNDKVKPQNLIRNKFEIRKENKIRNKLIQQNIE